MPLQRRRPVPLLPVPDLTGLKEDDPVFYLKATGEIFLDYESYSSRLSFLLSKTFQCESSGKSHLDYFTALQSEKQESKTVRERFPNELKSRVLKSVQGLKIGRLDKLVELVFERYKDRFFKGEKVFVDLSGDKYYARIAKVFPPQSIRDKFLQSSTPNNNDDDDDFSSIVHKIGTDLSLDIDDKQVKVLDPVEDYLYTVQLMDEEHKFEGSFMEVKQKNLSRDRLTFSKSILKRYMKECVTRETNSTTSPWIVKPSIAKALGIEPILLPTPTTTNDSDQKVDGGGSKRGRKSNVINVGGEETASKRRKIDTSNSNSAGVTSTTTTTSLSNNNNEGPKKAIKYPIEDLDLDPMSIHDGRVLRRTKTEVPTLPPKPKLRRDLPTRDNKELFDTFLESWNFLNTFSKPLSLSPFTMDDFIGALNHQTRAKAKSGGVDCILLAEIHSCLTNVIGTDLSRILGTSSISGLNGLNGKETANSGGGKKSNRNGNNGETTSRVGTPVPESNGGEEEEVDELDDDNNNNKEEEEEVLTPEAIFFSKLIKRGIQYGKRWDRQAKLKAETGREGWERHLIGCVCQRGGAFYLENFQEIMKHLFKGDPILNEEQQEGQISEKKKVDGDGNDVEMKNGEKVREEEEEKKAAEESDEAPKSSQLSELEEEDEEQHLVDGPCPEDQYLTLPLADKLAIINYLITLVTATKPIRAYLEEADRELTDLRKQRADVNKEKKALLERKLNEGKKATKTASSPTVNNDLRKSPAPSVSRATSPSIRNGDEEEDDELLTSDNESSVAPSEAGSVATRQTQKEEKLTQKRLSKLAATNSKSSSSSSKTPLPPSATKGGKSQSTLSLDEQIEDNSQMEEFVEKQFRRYLGVSRCRPLGKDRFHCRYWWFDGIGGMKISKPKTDGTRVQYSTGKIFVQGPNEQDWEVLTDAKAEKNKEREIVERRMREEVVETEEALVGVNEWGFYETPEEIESLLGWLNSKGTRELGLIKAITRWKDYIVAGCQERYKDLENPSRPRYDPKTTSSGRPSRNKAENDLPSTYLGYRNELKKY